ncbi:MAG TPA: hypothetical protein VM582_07990 [Candidatus Thermoplasmatota archaeon]|nr:hypothetical protein [Candidatus Thermoplasmatota archaeon]
MNAFQHALLDMWKEHAAEWERIRRRVARETRLRAWNPQLYGLPLYERFAREHLPPAPGALLAFGLNPGKYGMSQTGIPFTDVTRAARVGIALEPPGLAPASLHPFLKPYRVERSSASVYGLLDALWGDAARGWRELWAVAPCGLLFLEPDGTNVTPADARLARRHDVRSLRLGVMADAVALARPRAVVALGQDAARLTREALPGHDVVAVDHPVARGPGRRGPAWWAETVAARLRERGLV